MITQLSESLRGHNAIIVFVDRLTKMTYSVPTTTQVTSQEFAYIFLKEIYSKHGMPSDIVSDRDPRFTSGFFKEFALLSKFLRCEVQSRTCLSFGM